MVSRLKRWYSHITITAYLSVLVFGLFAHAFYFHVGSHPSMYFIVWDMLCGWNAYVMALRTTNTSGNLRTLLTRWGMNIKP